MKYSQKIQKLFGLILLVLICYSYGFGQEEMKKQRLLISDNAELPEDLHDCPEDNYIKSLGKKGLAGMIQTELIGWINSFSVLRNRLEIIDRNNEEDVAEDLRWSQIDKKPYSAKQLLPPSLGVDLYLRTKIEKPRLGWVSIRSKILTRESTSHFEDFFELPTAYLEDSISYKVQALVASLVGHVETEPSKACTIAGSLVFSGMGASATGFSIYNAREAKFLYDIASENFSEENWENYKRIQARRDALEWVAINQFINATPLILDWTLKGYEPKKWQLASFYSGGTVLMGVLGILSESEAKQAFNSLKTTSNKFTRAELVGEYNYHLEKKQIFYISAGLNAFAIVKILLFYNKKAKLKKANNGLARFLSSYHSSHIDLDITSKSIGLKFHTRF